MTGSLIEFYEETIAAIDDDIRKGEERLQSLRKARTLYEDHRWLFYREPAPAETSDTRGNDHDDEAYAQFLKRLLERGGQFPAWRAQEFANGTDFYQRARQRGDIVKTLGGRFELSTGATNRLSH